jgi:hypothetical protein
MVASLDVAVDVELVGQRILQLVELAVREHLEGVGRSQAEGLMQLMRDQGIDGMERFGRGIE